MAVQKYYKKIFITDKSDISIYYWPIKRIIRTDNNYVMIKVSEAKNGLVDPYIKLIAMNGTISLKFPFIISKFRPVSTDNFNYIFNCIPLYDYVTGS